MRKNARRIVAAVALVFVLLAAVIFWYVNDYYHADETALQATISTETVKVTSIENGLLFDGEGEDIALVFYPGAKVEYTAYAPLMMQLAENGIDCFLIKMPCNLAIFGVSSADNIIEEYDYGQWYMAGHSLGGAMAASYCTEHLDKINGLVLLAGYPTKSLQSNNFSVLSIYGSEDGVLNREKLRAGLGYMPPNHTEVCIEGGNHAWFGSYGEQDGDGTAQITHDEQWTQTVEAILAHVRFIIL